jgi:tetratricopeptide (TPR) repeat protein
MLIALLGAVITAPGAAAEKWPIDDANPSASIPSPEVRAKAPMEYGHWLFELTARGEKALSDGDHARATRYFEAVVRLLPEESIGHAKLCEARAGAGAIEEALPECQEAIERPGARVQDYVQFLAVTLARPQAVPAERVIAFDEALDHMEQENVQSAEAQRLNCQLALRQGDDARLATCVDKLTHWAPNDAKTAAFSWARAIRLRDEKGARAALRRAKELGHDPARLKEMQATMTKAFSTNSVWYLAIGSFALALAGLGLLLVLRWRTTPVRPASGALEQVS